MSRYLVESRHTPDECLKTLDDLVTAGPEGLPKWDFACAVGDHSNHIAYSTVDAPSSAAALASLPASMRGSATVTEIGKFTAEQVRSFH
jgi:hypothetical protein